MASLNVEQMSEPHLPVVLLMGPTASGKTGLALALAGRLPVEIVSVDSAQIYRGMDIGTAKPAPTIRTQVPHHLIDILDPAEVYSAARFAADAQELIVQIRARGRVPLLVGGTMLYFRALQQGLNALPPADPALRARIEDEARRHGWPALHARLQDLDPVTAARLHPNDQQRIQRALEIIEAGGMTPTAFYAQPRSGGLDGRVVKLALIPADRGLLHARIDRRFDGMIAEGFVDEVARLRARGDLRADMPSIRAVGYRQIWDHLEGHCSLDQAVSRAKAATRQYAKRQLTWLRAEEGVVVLDPGRPDLIEEALSRIRNTSGRHQP